ncbi:hypothetical protein ACIRL2_45665 [Embleya sp. NPDC127516]|uniref:hypothetical protein n=1 Tax=Embleya sp. NPDC127516 TaxID=3363990 RepID=UPI00381D5561
MMRELGIEGVIRGGRRRTTVAEPAAPRPSDLVDRVFTADGPARLRVADLTYVRTWSGAGPLPHPGEHVQPEAVTRVASPRQYGSRVAATPSVARIGHRVQVPAQVSGAWRHATHVRYEPDKSPSVMTLGPTGSPSVASSAS